MTLNLQTISRLIGAFWGIAGVCILLLFAVSRMAPQVNQAIGSGLSVGLWLVLAAWCILMLFTEGYLGFHKKFSPRVASRAFYMTQKASLLEIALAPLFCLGLFGAERQRIFASWVLLLGITILVTVVGLFPQPLRGIIDTGVVVGLLYGIFSFLYFSFITFVKKEAAVDPGVT